MDQIQLILDQKIKLVAGVHNDNNDSVASSALALTAELKSFFKSNFEKANFISKKLDKVRLKVKIRLRLLILSLLLRQQKF